MSLRIDGSRPLKMLPEQEALLTSVIVRSAFFNSAQAYFYGTLTSTNL
jgi:hypothetical protein